MSKGNVLALLREDEYISGEEISRKLGVSRAAVWKAVKALRGEGEPLVKPEQAFTVTMILDHIYKAATTGKTIYFD